MISHPCGDSRIGVQVNAAGTGVLVQITDSDGEQARAILRPKDVVILIGWLEAEKTKAREGAE